MSTTSVGLDPLKVQEEEFFGRASQLPAKNKTAYQMKIREIFQGATASLGALVQVTSNLQAMSKRSSPEQMRALAEKAFQSFQKENEGAASLASVAKTVQKAALPPLKLPERKSAAQVLAHQMAHQHMMETRVVAQGMRAVDHAVSTVVGSVVKEAVEATQAVCARSEFARAVVADARQCLMQVVSGMQASYRHFGVDRFVERISESNRRWKERERVALGRQGFSSPQVEHYLSDMDTVSMGAAWVALGSAGRPLRDLTNVFKRGLAGLATQVGPGTRGVVEGAKKGISASWKPALEPFLPEPFNCRRVLEELPRSSPSFPLYAVGSGAREEVWLATVDALSPALDKYFNPEFTHLHRNVVRLQIGEQRFKIAVKDCPEVLKGAVDALESFKKLGLKRLLIPDLWACGENTLLNEYFMMTDFIEGKTFNDLLKQVASLSDPMSRAVMLREVVHSSFALGEALAEMQTSSLESRPLEFSESLMFHIEDTMGDFSNSMIALTQSQRLEVRKHVKIPLRDLKRLAAEFEQNPGPVTKQIGDPHLDNFVWNLPAKRAALIDFEFLQSGVPAWEHYLVKNEFMLALEYGLTMPEIVRLQKAFTAGYEAYPGFVIHPPADRLGRVLWNIKIAGEVAEAVGDRAAPFNLEIFEHLGRQIHQDLWVASSRKK